MVLPSELDVPGVLETLSGVVGWEEVEEPARAGVDGWYRHPSLGFAFLRRSGDQLEVVIESHRGEVRHHHEGHLREDKLFGAHLEEPSRSGRTR